MWQLTASASIGDASQAEATAVFLRSHGFEVQLQEVNTDLAAIDLV